jgi:hypothetical protein
VYIRDIELAAQREIATAKRVFPLPQQIEKVHQDVALSGDGSGSEDEDYQRARGSGEGRRLFRDERVMLHEPLGDCECGHTSDI